MSNQAWLLKAQGKLDEAKPLMLEVLEARRATLGPKHPDTLTSMGQPGGGCCRLRESWGEAAAR